MPDRYTTTDRAPKALRRASSWYADIPDSSPTPSSKFDPHSASRTPADFQSACHAAGRDELFDAMHRLRGDAHPRTRSSDRTIGSSTRLYRDGPRDSHMFAARSCVCARANKRHPKPDDRPLPNLHRTLCHDGRRGD